MNSTGRRNKKTINSEVKLYFQIYKNKRAFKLKAQSCRPTRILRVVQLIEETMALP